MIIIVKAIAGINEEFIGVYPWNSINSGNDGN